MEKDYNQFQKYYVADLEYKQIKETLNAFDWFWIFNWAMDR